MRELICKKIEEWKIREPDGSETIWAINSEGGEVIVSNETHHCFVGRYDLFSDWQDRLEAVIYYYMRKSLITKTIYGMGFTTIKCGYREEEWFSRGNPAYDRLLKRIRS